MVMSPALPTAHERCGKMGTLEKDGLSKPLSFDGKAASWPPFKKALHQLLDKEGCGWVVKDGNAFLRHATSSRRPGGQEYQGAKATGAIL